MPDGASLPFMGGVLVCVPQPAPHWPARRQCCFNAVPSPPTANKNAVESVQYGVAGSAAFLECQPRSPQATVKWLFQRDPSDRRREVISVPHGPPGAEVLCPVGVPRRSGQLSF